MSTPSPMDHASEYGFWIIWCPSGKHPPRYRHGTEESAVKEAERLAMVYQGTPFYVMAATHRAYRAQYVTVPLILPVPVNEDDIPF